MRENFNEPHWASCLDKDVDGSYTRELARDLLEWAEFVYELGGNHNVERALLEIVPPRYINVLNIKFLEMHQKLGMEEYDISMKDTSNLSLSRLYQGMSNMKENVRGPKVYMDFLDEEISNLNVLAVKYCQNLINLKASIEKADRDAAKSIMLDRGCTAIAILALLAGGTGVAVLLDAIDSRDDETRLEHEMRRAEHNKKLNEYASLLCDDAVQGTWTNTSGEEVSPETSAENLPKVVGSFGLGNGRAMVGDRLIVHIPLPVDCLEGKLPDVLATYRPLRKDYVKVNGEHYHFRPDERVHQDWGKVPEFIGEGPFKVKVGDISVFSAQALSGDKFPAGVQRMVNRLENAYPGQVTVESLD